MPSKTTVPPTQTSCIFLPAAGNRNNDELNNAGSNGNYWSSSANGSLIAWILYFGGSDAGVNDYYRSSGLSVRLVRVVQN